MYDRFVRLLETQGTPQSEIYYKGMESDANTLLNIVFNYMLALALLTKSPSILYFDFCISGRSQKEVLCVKILQHVFCSRK